MIGIAEDTILIIRSNHPNVSCVLFDDHLSLPDALPIPVSVGRHAYSTPIILPL